MAAANAAAEGGESFWMTWAVLLGFEMIWTVQDCARQKIYRILLFSGILTGAGFAVYRAATGQDTVFAWAASLLPGALLLAYGFMTEGKLGKADGYMVLALGLFLGWEICTAILAAACLLAALYAGIGLALKKLTRSSRISFAPFLLLGTLAVRILM